MTISGRRVVVLGGGLGALAAAYELATAPVATGDPPWEVTVYQLGWRLGGRCASSRNAGLSMRSEEHGLHIWFGFYQNAFGLMERVYAQLGRPASHPFRDVASVFVGRGQAVFGSLLERNGAWPIAWPKNPGNPWDPSPPSPIDAVRALVSWVEGGLGAAVATVGVTSIVAPITLALPPAGQVLTDAVLGLAQRTLRTLRAAFVGPFNAAAAADATGTVRRQWVLLDLAIAVLDGLFDPADGVLSSGDLGRIDHWEFRDWMRRHGAQEDHLWEPPVRAMYDTAFAYRDGDPTRPSWAAGVAVRVFLRIALSYRGDVFHVPVAGFGEVVVQPLYEALLAKGVKFEFFHRVDALDASPDLREITRVRLTQQAAPKAAPYVPTIPVSVAAGTFEAWPVEPDWSQLVNGLALRSGGVDFESRWSAHPETPKVLELGRDFDHVVLGIPFHAAREVLGAFADHCILGPSMRDVEAIPSIAMQLWMDVPPSALQDLPSPGLVGGPRAFDIWTDMTQSLSMEPWPSAAPPKSVQYLCATFPFAGVNAPAAATGVQARADADARAAASRFLETACWSIWPKLLARGAAFPWDKLHDPSGAVGPARLGAQLVRAHVDPTQCCPSSFAGTIANRPTAGGTGVRNLYLANDSVRTGLDTSCVESAVMAGRQAAREILGAQFDVPGEGFLASLPTRASAEAKAIACAATAAAVAAGGRAALLPPYVDHRGLGEVSVRGPFAFDGCNAWMFPLDADLTKLQALVDARLNAPTGGAFGFEALVSRVVLLWLHGKRGYSLGEAVGSTPDNEMAVALVLQYRVPGEGPRLAFWMPYMVIDSPMGMVAGRETWGFPKEFGAISPPQPATGLSCSMSALSFEPFSQQGAGATRTLVSITDSAPGTPPGVVASGNFLSTVITMLGGPVGALLPLFGLDPGRVPIVNLKEFRDAEDDTKACVMQVVESSFQLQPRSVGVYPQAVSYDFATPVASHDFVGRLLPNTAGIEKGTITGVVTADFDFQVGAGRIIWPPPAP